MSVPLLRSALILGIALAAGLSHPRLTSAQLITGQLKDRDTGVPVPHTPVLLVDGSDREVLRSPTDEDGRFTLSAPGPGWYSLRAERVGWDVTPSGSFRIDRGQTRRLVYEAAMTPVVLANLPPGATTCRIEDNPRAGLAWREVRKALRAVVWTVAARRYQYRARTFERDLGLDGREVRSERDSVLTGLDQVPYAALDPESLAEEGYIRTGDDGSTTYFVPDAAALLDDRFAESHCFSLTDGMRAGLAGLSFTPTSDRAVPEIAGTVWLDAATLHLVRIDFQYHNDPSGMGNEPARGTIEFGPIQGPDWMVRGWRVRIPAVAAAPDSAGGARVSGFFEVGAYVTEVTDDGTRQLFSDAAVAVLSGAAFDSTLGGPLVDGIIALAGTRHWTTTDRDGRFMLAGHLDGDYAVVFGSVRLDSLGFVSRPHKVSLERGRESSLDLVVPSVATGIGRRCSDFVAAPNRRVLVGVVKDADSHAPVPAAVVSVFRQVIPENLLHLARADLRLTASTDSLGAYTLCGVPIDETIMVYAEDQDRTSNFVSVTFRVDGVDFDQQRLEGSGHPVARLDLELVSPGDRISQLSGVVTSQATQAPILGAMVQIDGTGFITRTDSSGTFRLMGVPSGRFRLLVRQFGFRMLQHSVEISDETALSLSPGTLALIPGDTAIVLDPITIEAEGVARQLVGFERRRKTGRGSFAAREEFEKWNPAHAIDVLRRMRGLRVRPNPYYGAGSDGRRWVIESSRDIGRRVTRIISTEAERVATSAGGSTQTVVYECPVLLFLDGAFLGDTYTSDVNNIVTTTNLLAVEFYTPSQVPIRFALPGSTCGVVVFWTR